MIYVLAYDIGTTGLKAGLYSIGSKKDDGEYSLHRVRTSNRGYNLYSVENGGVEQSADEWWEAMSKATAEIFENSDISGSMISGISFCSQMQGLVLVDKEGIPVRRPMSYMDQRAKEEIKKGIAYGPQIAGANIFKLLKSLKITGAVSCSVKDPIWKYKWIEAHEPENFKRADKWLDVKEYMICRCTGETVMTEDSAYATLLYDVREGKKCWSREMCDMFGINMSHLPKIIATTDIAGKLTPKAAEELSLPAGIPVYGGGGDASMIGIGSGCVHTGETHIYSGTSGWVSTVTDKQMVDADNMIAAIVGAIKGHYNYFAEMETAGKCLEWVKEHMALDEIGVYLDKHDICENSIKKDGEKVYRSLYDYMSEVVSKVPAGSRGVVFTPWLHGNRCPFEDSNAAGIFFNINLDTGKSDMIRAVLEGVCFHLRWMLECQDKKIKTSDTIRFSGGGALSDVTCQILSDAIGRVIEVVRHPQDVGSIGAAATVAVGLGVLSSLDEIPMIIKVEKTFRPDASKRPVYDRNYAVFKRLYKDNRESFEMLNKQLK